MNIDAVYRIEEMYEHNGVTVAIDVLRASTTVSVLLNNGAKSIRVFSSLAQADMYWLSLGGGSKAVYVGERGGKKTTNAQYNNSPLELYGEIMTGKEVVMTTSNLTRAFDSSSVGQFYTACYRNMRSVIKHLVTKEADKNITVLACGTSENYGIEDMVCAGYFIRGLVMEASLAQVPNYPSDKASALLMLANNINHKDSMQNTLASKYIARKEIEVCAEYSPDIVVPVVRKNLGEIKIENILQ